MNSPHWWKFSTLAAVGAVFSPFLSLSDSKAGNAAPEIPRKDFTGAPEYAVLRIVSGDTVILNVDEAGQRIGLFGAKAPPLSEPSGREAQRMLENLLKGETVYLEHPAGRPRLDKFGRHPAYLYRAPEGLFVNLELVRQGYAKAADEPAFAHRALFEHFEERAKKCQKGQWGAPAPLQAEETDAAPAAAESDEKKAASSAGDSAVYITPSGKKYHRKDCYHLRKNRTPTSLREAKQRGYGPCSHCKPPK